MLAPGQSAIRFCGEHHDLPTGSGAEHGRNARNGARTSDARGWRHLPAGRFLVSRKRGRLHLDGAVVPAMVWRYRASPRKVPDLQGLESTSSGRRRSMMLEIDQECLNREIEELARLSDGQAPGVTRIVFTATDLEARALLKDRCEKAGLAV